MRTRLALLLAALLAAALLAAACGDDDGDDDGDGAETTGAAVAPAAYPVTVRDLLGREVTLEAKPERIVTTSPSAIELLHESGGTAIGRSTTATFLAGTADLEDVGPSYAPAFEKIIALNPDLVIADASAQGHLAEAFTGSLPQVPVAFVGAVEYADLAASVRLIGTLIGDADGAAAAAATFEDPASRIRAAVGEEAPTPTLVLVAGREGGISAALPGSFVGSVIEIAGAENVAAALPPSGPFSGYAQLSLEAIIDDDPAVILVITPGGGPSLSATIAEQFPTLAAVQSERVHDIDLEVYLQAPGPRAAAGLPALASLLHPGCDCED